MPHGVCDSVVTFEIVVTSGGICDSGDFCDSCEYCDLCTCVILVVTSCDFCDCMWCLPQSRVYTWLVLVADRKRTDDPRDLNCEGKF